MAGGGGQKTFLEGFSFIISEKKYGPSVYDFWTPLPLLSLPLIFQQIFIIIFFII